MFINGLNQDGIVELADLRRQAGAIAVKLKVLWRSSAFQDDQENIGKIIDEPIGSAGDSILIEHIFQEVASLYKSLEILESSTVLAQAFNIVTKNS